MLLRGFGHDHTPSNGFVWPWQPVKWGSVPAKDRPSVTLGRSRPTARSGFLPGGRLCGSRIKSGGSIRGKRLLLRLGSSRVAGEPQRPKPRHLGRFGHVAIVMILQRSRRFPGLAGCPLETHLCPLPGRLGRIVLHVWILDQGRTRRTVVRSAAFWRYRAQRHESYPTASFCHQETEKSAGPTWFRGAARKR